MIVRGELAGLTALDGGMQNLVQGTAATDAHVVIIQGAKPDARRRAHSVSLLSAGGRHGAPLGINFNVVRHIGI